MKKIFEKVLRFVKKMYLCGPKGTLPERLGIGLQNRGRRFESARYLTSLLSFGGLFS